MNMRARVMLLLAFACSTLAPAAPVQAVTFKIPYLKALKSLVVSREVRTGYQRDLFRHWVDADGDGCDARDEVLIAESKKRVTIGAGCSLSGGTWASAYDGIITTNPSSFDIDHMVPLAEAWDSGARYWTSAQREAYANDLGDPRTLIAVTASSNRSKSDQDPAEWLPSQNVCQYVQNWIAVKVRWRLSVDTTEKSALRARLSKCPKRTLTVTVASVPKATRVAGGSAASAGGSGGSAGTSTGSVYYANCTAVRAAGAAPILRGAPGYRAGLDRDGDGVGCE